MSAAKSGRAVPYQRSATPSMNAESPAPVARVKTHPWRAFNPGWIKSDPDRAQKVIPTHARIVQR